MVPLETFKSHLWLTSYLYWTVPLCNLLTLLLLFSRILLFVTPWTAARQAVLSFTISQSLLKFMSIESG